MEEEQLNVKPNDKSIETFGGFAVDALWLQYCVYVFTFIVMCISKNML